MKPTSILNACWAGAAEPKKYAEFMQTLVAAQPKLFSVPFFAMENDKSADQNQISMLKETELQISNTLQFLEQDNPQQIQNIGCDCGTDFAPISYLLSKHKSKLGVIWFDAHADLNTPQTSPSGHFHGMVLRALTGDTIDLIKNQLSIPLDPANILLVGVRELDDPERDYIQAHKVSVLDAREFTLDRYEEALRKLTKNGITHVYVHIDLDVLEPEEFPWVGCPTPDGLSIENMVSALSLTRRTINVVGMSAVEISSAAEHLAQLESILTELGFHIGQP